MKKHFFLLILVLCSNLLIAQNFQNEFARFFKENDTVNQKLTLQKWEKSNNKDPELYTSYFNFYFQKGRKEILNLSTIEPDGENIEFKDSLNNTAGYIGSSILYNDSDVKKSFEKIDKGISLFPNRLDMRFGKIYALGLLEDWNNFTKEIISVIQHSKVNNNKWVWTNNQSKENGKDFLLSSIQSYQVQLYDTGNDDLLINMEQIAIEILKLYPDNIESMSNLSITYYLTNQYNKAIEILLKAEKLAPKDAIVLANIANGYRLNGDKKKAITYYKKVIELGNSDLIESSKQQIELLSK